MKGKVAVVTGGGRGIGYATVVRFLSEGVSVVVADISPQATDHLQRVARKGGARVLPVRADVTDLGSVRETGRRAMEEFGRLDIWVNNAGCDRIGPFLSSDPREWQKVLAVNLMGTIHGTRVALEHMVEGKAGGAIVNVASDAGRVGSAGEAVYSGAKGGVIAFTKAVAREMARHDIRVNAVSPGPTDTPMLPEYFPGKKGQAVIESIRKGIPLRRLGTPDEIAGVIRFLASDEASFVTGQVLSANGGLNMSG